MTEPHPRPAIWMLAGALFFALMGVQTHALGPRCAWIIVSLARAVFMFATASILAILANRPLHFLRPPTLWLRSLAGSFSLVCNFYALTALPVSDALTLGSMYPLWILLMSSLLLRRAPKRGECLGVAAALIGVALVQRPHLQGDRIASLAAILSSVSTAIAMLGLHRLRDVDTRSVVAHFAGVASIVAALWLLLLQPHAFVGFVPDALTLCLIAGVCISGTLGQLCLTRAYAAGAPTRVSIIGLSQVPFAAVFDFALWNHRFTPTGLLGMLLVLTPTALLMASAQTKLAALRHEPVAANPPQTIPSTARAISDHASTAHPGLESNS